MQHIRLYAHYYDGSECGRDYGIFRGYPSWADLYDFVGKYRSDAVGATFTVKQIDAGAQYNPGQPQVEPDANTRHLKSWHIQRPLTSFTALAANLWARMTGSYPDLAQIPRPS